jgi:hypothetical protein
MSFPINAVGYKIFSSSEGLPNPKTVVIIIDIIDGNFSFNISPVAV